LKITKTQLRKIIKETIKEENALTRNIDRWSEEGKDVPVGKTVGRAERSDQLDAIINHMSTDLGKAMDVVSYLVMNADQAVLDKWFKGRGLLGDPGA
jgi:ABC-type phosphate transport system substrate-binding protein